MKIENLRKSYGEKLVLSGVSLSAKPGERILLRGGNGSGKTTLLKILAGTLLADSGSIDIDRPVAWLPATEAGFWPRLKGRTALELYARLWKVSPSHFDRAIENWSSLKTFREALELPTFELSTGNRQLLHFARVLMTQPKVILADEPFRSIDSDNQKFILERINEDAREALLIASSPSPINQFSWSQTWVCNQGSVR